MNSSAFPGLLCSLAASLVWGVLAGLNPETTYHLAPAVVTMGYPVSAAGTGASWRYISGATAAAAAMAIAVAAILSSLHLLAGSALMPGGPFAEAVVVTGIAAVLTIPAAIVLRRRSTSKQSQIRDDS